MSRADSFCNGSGSLGLQQVCGRVRSEKMVKCTFVPSATPKIKVGSTVQDLFRHGEIRQRKIFSYGKDDG
jgi:hypothetical protein